jgi:hypothetical protein
MASYQHNYSISGVIFEPFGDVSNKHNIYSITF